MNIFELRQWIETRLPWWVALLPIAAYLAVLGAIAIRAAVKKYKLTKPRG